MNGWRDEQRTLGPRQTQTQRLSVVGGHLEASPHHTPPQWSVTSLAGGMSEVLVTLGPWMCVLARERALVLRALGSRLEELLCWCVIRACVVSQ